jgi:ABC-type multidrug transport system ATPase subunit
MVVTARDLSARRGAFVLTVEAFEAGRWGTAVLGPNGAGKTTLLLALQGLIPAAGRLERPARCAAVFARPALLRGTALWNVSVVARATLGVDTAAADERAHRVLAEVGLAQEAGMDARLLSTGQRQRLALARALAAEPQALFLDEPFANVDADGRPALRDLVRAYADRTGAIVIIATASLADASALCRDAVVLRGGAVCHEGAVRLLSAVTDPYVRALVAEASAATDAPAVR